MELNRFRKTSVGPRDVEEYGFGMEEIQAAEVLVEQMERL